MCTQQLSKDLGLPSRSSVKLGLPGLGLQSQACTPTPGAIARKIYNDQLHHPSLAPAQEELSGASAVRMVED